MTILDFGVRLESTLLIFLLPLASLDDLGDFGDTSFPSDLSFNIFWGGVIDRACPDSTSLEGTVAEETPSLVILRLDGVREYFSEPLRSSGGVGGPLSFELGFGSDEAFFRGDVLDWRGRSRAFCSCEEL